jgi:serine/threonine-protein kinase
MIWPFGVPKQRFGEYHAVRLLHQGEKSVVYLAEPPGGPGGSVAIKLYRPQYDRFARRLEEKHGIPSEAEVGRRLSPKTPAEVPDYPIVTTKSEGREFGRRTGSRYVVLEYVEGVSLKSLISCRDPRVSARRVAFPADCCRALGIIHAAGFVCRDFGSQNLMVQPSGRLKLLDLGFVAPAGMAFPERSGTPPYMSPEQVAAQPLTPASDIYALGIVLYEIITGSLPYVSAITGEDLESLEARRKEVMQMHLERPAPEFAESVRRRSPRLCAIATQCLQKDPAARFQSAEELLAALKYPK